MVSRRKDINQIKMVMAKKEIANRLDQDALNNLRKLERCESTPLIRFRD